HLTLVQGPGLDQEALRVAASLAAASRHPLARALVAAAGPVPVADGVVEHAGEGLRAGDVRLGSRDFISSWPGLTRPSAHVRLGVDGRVKPGHDDCEWPELWLDRPACTPVRFMFWEILRGDATA